MSRSFRKRPFAAMCGNGSQKVWKQIYNRSMRRVNRVFMNRDGDAEVFLIVPEVMDVWSMPRDGKRRYRPWEPHRDRMFPTAYVMSYRSWWRWVKAK